MIATTIHQATSKGGSRQDLHFDELCNIGPHRCRIRIHVDASYRAQSSAVIERWNGEQWREVWRLHPPQMSYRDDIGVNGLKAHDFEGVRSFLIFRAIEVFA